jgi:homoserine kinase
LVLAGKELKVNEARPGIGDSKTVIQGLQPEELLALATSIEGHPDNVAPAIYGGIQLSVQVSSDTDHGAPAHGAVISRRIPTPNGLRLVAYVPSEKQRLKSGLEKTETMRNLLKPTVDRKDAVTNIQRTALLIDALHRGDLEALRFATTDTLHQPQRAAAAYPYMNQMVRAALEAGAHGAFLSGAGPTVVAMCSGQAGDIFTQRATERQEGVVAEAMSQALDNMPLEDRETWGKGKFYMVSPTSRGAHVVSAEPKFSSSLATFGSLDGAI